MIDYEKIRKIYHNSIDIEEIHEIVESQIIFLYAKINKIEDNDIRVNFQNNRPTSITIKKKETIQLAKLDPEIIQSIKRNIYKGIKYKYSQIQQLEYDKLLHTMCSGKVFSVSNNTQYNILININNTISILPTIEQIPNETYEMNKFIKFYIIAIKYIKHTPQFILSRTHPMLLYKLLELYVPEINNKEIEIINIMREPGYRAKVIVNPLLDNINAQSACIGIQAKRILNISQELNNEKIDIINYSSNITQMIKNAFKPTNIEKVKIISEIEQKADIYTTKEEYKAAIGKNGMHVRLVSNLLKWHINILTI